MSVPKKYLKFKESYPEIFENYEKLGEATHLAGPLDAKTRALVKLAISIGAHLEGAASSHTRKASEAGCSLEEMKHVALLSLPTLGFPSMMAALGWIDKALEEKK